jgi:hypothetical protein
MFQLCFDIRVGNYRFRQVTSVSIESSWKSPGATASIEIPGLKGLLAKGRHAIKRGDVVSIDLGYDGKLVREFDGYVTHVDPNIPMKIECEDALFLLRKVDIKEGGKTKLTDILDIVAKAVPSITVATNGYEEVFTGLRLNYNAATLLQKFVDDYGLSCYFRNNTLVVGEHGFVMSNVPGRIVVLAQGNNVINTNLTFKTAEERKIRFKVLGFDLKKKTRYELNIGDADEEGELRTLLIRGNNVAEAKQKALAEIERFKYDGYEGSITTFGFPFVQHSDLVEFRDLNFPERSGTYEVDAVRVTSGVSGYRREITLGRGLLSNA